MLSCGTTGRSATSCFTSEGERLVCTVEALVPAHPQGHLPVEGDFAVLFRNGEGFLFAALEQHVEAQPVLVKAGAQLHGEGRAHDGARDVRVLPKHVVFAADGPEEPRNEAFRNFDPVPVVVEVVPIWRATCKSWGDWSHHSGLRRICSSDVS